MGFKYKMADEQCPYCQRTFSNRHNRKVHEMTARYCIAARRRANARPQTVSSSAVDDDEKSLHNQSYQCPHCQKTFTSKQTFTYHTKICKKTLIHDMQVFYEKQLVSVHERYQQTIEELQERIRTLEGRLQERTFFHQVA